MVISLDRHRQRGLREAFYLNAKDVVESFGVSPWYVSDGGPDGPVARYLLRTDYGHLHLRVYDDRVETWFVSPVLAAGFTGFTHFSADFDQRPNADERYVADVILHIERSLRSINPRAVREAA